MGSALLNTAADREFAGDESDFASAPSLPDGDGSRLERAATVAGTAGELRTQVAERLAAHRSRRGAARVLAATEPVRAACGGRSAQIAAAVAERYARTPSYRAVLAAEAERAIQQARAAAEVAALNAQAIAAAQQRLLEAYDEHASREASLAETLLAAAREDVERDGFATSSEGVKADAAQEQELWPDLALGGESGTRAGTARVTKATPRGEGRKTANGPGDRTAGTNPTATTTAARTAAARPAARLTVRLYEQDTERGGVLSAAGASTPARERFREERGYATARGYREERSEAEAMALDEEIAFRQAPVFEEPAGPPVALPANLIEFPRQLVAARKARPRYAEGPLRDEMEAAPGDGQLRIFEVDPAQISTSPVEAEAQTAQWTSLWLDAPERAAAGTDTLPAEALLDEPLGRPVAVLQPASLARRAAAGAINLAIVGCGLAAFGAIFATVAGYGISGHDIALRVGLAELMQGGLQLRSMATIGAVSCMFLLMLYHGLFFWFSTATPGMRSVRIALCTFDDENPTRAGVRRRMAATMLSSCSLGMGYAWAALDEQRLTWHDRISRMYLRRY